MEYEWSASGKGKGRHTAESTSYTRKPEFRLVNGVIEGPIWRVSFHLGSVIPRNENLTHPAVSAVCALIVVALLA